MKRLWTWLLVIPALLLVATSDANAQRRGGFGISIGTGGFGYPGLGYGYGGFNRGFGYSPLGYGYSPFGYGYGGTGLSISLGNNWNRSGYGNYGYNNYYNNYYNNGYYPRYSSGYYNPGYSTGSYYSYPTYSNGVTYYTTPSSSMSGSAQSSYTMPTYTTDSGVVQAGAWSSEWNSGMMTSTPAAAKVKLTVPNNAEVWVDGKQSEGTGTTREFTTDALTSWKNVKLKIKDGDSTREFTMPVRPGENSTVDITPLLR